MTRDQAVRTDQDIPDSYEVMRTVTCIKCATDFNIIHHVSSADIKRADTQADEFRSQLASQHGDDKDHRHSKYYCIDESYR
jgi:hypothetical protein